MSEVADADSEVNDVLTFVWLVLPGVVVAARVAGLLPRSGRYVLPLHQFYRRDPGPGSQPFFSV